MGFFVRVINLDRSQDRLATFKAYNPNLHFERAPAIDGSQLPRTECIQNGLITAMNEYPPRALGIAASHVGLWRECAAGTEPFHIAEDDAVFHNDFMDFAAGLIEKIPDWDIVYWGFNFDWPVEIEFTSAIGPTVMQFDQDAMRGQMVAYRAATLNPSLLRLHSCGGIAAYSISPAGARRYLTSCLPIGNIPIPLVLNPLGTSWENSGLDVEMSRHHRTLSAHVCIPPLAITPNYTATA